MAAKSSFHSPKFVAEEKDTSADISGRSIILGNQQEPPVPFHGTSVTGPPEQRQQQQQQKREQSGNSGKEQQVEHHDHHESLPEIEPRDEMHKMPSGALMELVQACLLLLEEATNRYRTEAVAPLLENIRVRLDIKRQQLPLGVFAALAHITLMGYEALSSRRDETIPTKEKKLIKDRMDACENFVAESLVLFAARVTIKEQHIFPKQADIGLITYKVGLFSTIPDDIVQTAAENANDTLRSNSSAPTATPPFVVALPAYVHSGLPRMTALSATKVPVATPLANQPITMDSFGEQLKVVKEFMAHQGTFRKPNTVRHAAALRRGEITPTSIPLNERIFEFASEAFQKLQSAATALDCEQKASSAKENTTKTKMGKASAKPFVATDMWRLSIRSEKVKEYSQALLKHHAAHRDHKVDMAKATYLEIMQSLGKNLSESSVEVESVVLELVEMGREAAAIEAGMSTKARMALRETVQLQTREQEQAAEAARKKKLRIKALEELLPPCVEKLESFTSDFVYSVRGAYLSGKEVRDHLYKQTQALGTVALLSELSRTTLADLEKETGIPSGEEVKQRIEAAEIFTATHWAHLAKNILKAVDSTQLNLVHEKSYHAEIDLLKTGILQEARRIAENTWFGNVIKIVAHPPYVEQGILRLETLTKYTASRLAAEAAHPVTLAMFAERLAEVKYETERQRALRIPGPASDAASRRGEVSLISCSHDVITISVALSVYERLRDTIYDQKERHLLQQRRGHQSRRSEELASLYRHVLDLKMFLHDLNRYYDENRNDKRGIASKTCYEMPMVVKFLESPDNEAIASVALEIVEMARQEAAQTAGMTLADQETLERAVHERTATKRALLQAAAE